MTGSGLHVRLCAGPLGSKAGSLLEVADFTRSRAGARLLRQWLAQPLVSESRILDRQDAVSELLETPELLQRVQEVRAPCHGPSFHLPIYSCCCVEW
jgi:hypothetical protein